jgi:hypothetical protein
MLIAVATCKPPSEEGTANEEETNLLVIYRLLKEQV